MTDIINGKYARTLDDVEKLVEYAKLNLSDLHPVTQTLSFSEGYKNDNSLKLLEVDSKILDYVCEGKRVIIRGSADDNTVLCTESQTYEIREAETSNALFLTSSLMVLDSCQNEGSHSLSENEIEEVHYKYYELKLCKPQYSKLIKLLSENTYKEISDGNKTGKYKWDDLLSNVQCSEEEIIKGLCEIMAYKIGDYWRLLDFDYHFNVLSLMLNLIDSNSWSVEAISKQDILETLKDKQPSTILEQCFDYFFEEKNDKELYSINSENVSRFLAEVLLKPAGKFSLAEFQSIWQQSVPDGVVTDLSYLRGVALINKTSTPHLISHFPISDLPDDLLSRLNVLFDTMDIWEYKDIEPYLMQFSTDSLTVRTLLNKHAKLSRKGEKEFYIKRHSK